MKNTEISKQACVTKAIENGSISAEEPVHCGKLLCQAIVRVEDEIIISEPPCQTQGSNDEPPTLYGTQYQPDGLWLV